jgi:hypothetical protein
MEDRGRCSKRLKHCGDETAETPKTELISHHDLVGEIGLKKYLPSVGFIDCEQISKASQEWERLQSNNPDRVVVARNINLLEWLQSDLRRCPAVFEAAFDAGIVDEKTKADVYISKVRGAIHNDVLVQIAATLYNYCRENLDYLSVGAGELTIPQAGRTRRCDSFVHPFPVRKMELCEQVHGILKVDVDRRNVTEALKAALEYFDDFVRLRFLVLIKILVNREDGKFGALAVLLTRRGGVSTVSDAVSFGTGPLPEHSLPSEVAERLRRLPHPPPGCGREKVSPWTADGRAWLQISAADVLLLRTPAGSGGPSPSTQPPVLEVEGAPTEAEDLRLDLWRVLHAADKQLRVELADARAKETPRSAGPPA